MKFEPFFKKCEPVFMKCEPFFMKCEPVFMKCEPVLKLNIHGDSKVAIKACEIVLQYVIPSLSRVSIPNLEQIPTIPQKISENKTILNTQEHQNSHNLDFRSTWILKKLGCWRLLSDI